MSTAPRPDLADVWQALDDYGSACFDVGLQQGRDDCMRFVGPTVAMTDARRWRKDARHHVVDALARVLGVSS